MSNRKLDPRFTLGWKIIAAAAVIWEFLALALRGRGDTLSEHIWAIRDNPNSIGLFSLLIFLLIWAIYHFVREG